MAPTLSQFDSLSARRRSLSLLGGALISFSILLAIARSQRVDVIETEDELQVVTATTPPPPPPPPPTRETRASQAQAFIPEGPAKRSVATFVASPRLDYSPSRPDVEMDVHFDPNEFAPKPMKWTTNRVFAGEEIDQGPIPIQLVRPDVSRKLAKSVNLDQVIIMFIVNTRGQVEKPYVLNSDSREFNHAILEAIRKCRFKPGLVDGKPANCLVRMPIRVSAETASPFSRP